MKHALWIALLALSACDKPAPGSSSGPTPSEPASGTSPTTSPAEPEPGPEPIRPRLFVTANETDAPKIPAGWPLVLQVTLHAPPEVPLKLAAGSGPWSSLLHLTPPGPAWKLKPVEITDSSISLDDSTSGLLLWTMTAEELDAIPRGTYRIEALLETRDSPEGAWSGTARASPALVTLVKAIAKPTEDQEVDRARFTANVLRLRGDAAGANRESDALLKKFPKNTLAILLRVDLLEADGKRAEALAFLDGAIDAVVGPNPTVQNYPKALARRREELTAVDEDK